MEPIKIKWYTFFVENKRWKEENIHNLTSKDNILRILSSPFGFFWTYTFSVASIKLTHVVSYLGCFLDYYNHEHFRFHFEMDSSNRFSNSLLVQKGRLFLLHEVGSTFARRTVSALSTCHPSLLWRDPGGSFGRSSYKLWCLVGKENSRDSRGNPIFPERSLQVVSRRKTLTTTQGSMGTSPVTPPGRGRGPQQTWGTRAKATRTRPKFFAVPQSHVCFLGEPF
jgi:hypothetical protein